LDLSLVARNVASGKLRPLRGPSGGRQRRPKEGTGHPLQRTEHRGQALDAGNERNGPQKSPLVIELDARRGTALTGDAANQFFSKCCAHRLIRYRAFAHKWWRIGQSACTDRARLGHVAIKALDADQTRTLRISTNAELSRTGWKRGKEMCDRNDAHAGYSDSNHDERDAQCWVLNHVGQTLSKNARQAHSSIFIAGATPAGGRTRRCASSILCEEG
jgi:hypothetical protein